MRRSSPFVESPRRPPVRLVAPCDSYHGPSGRPPVHSDPDAAASPRPPFPSPPPAPRAL